MRVSRVGCRLHRRCRCDHPLSSPMWLTEVPVALFSGKLSLPVSDETACAFAAAPK